MARRIMTTPTASPTVLKSRTLRDYPFQLRFPTRWADNDQYGHLNNTVYGQLIDSIVNIYLIERCGLQPQLHQPDKQHQQQQQRQQQQQQEQQQQQQQAASQIALIVSSWCNFFSATSFPTILFVGLRVHALGSSSVSYEVGIFSPTTSTTTTTTTTTTTITPTIPEFVPPVVVNAVGGCVHVFVDRVHRRPTKEGMPRETRVNLEKLLLAPGSGGNGAGQGDSQREIDKEEARSSGLKETKAKI